MTKRRTLCLLLLAMPATALLAAAQPNGLALRTDGIQFPDGSLQTTAAGAYANLIVVAKSGGHFETIQGALDSITDNAKLNPYLVWIAPGVYQERVSMKRFVDMRGAGRDATVITYSGHTTCDLATLKGADDSEISGLTVESSGFSQCNVAILNFEASPRLTDLTVRSIRGTVNVGILNQESSNARLRHVDVEACTTLAEQVRCLGIWNETASSAKIFDGRVYAHSGLTDNYGILNDGPQTSVYVKDAVVQAVHGSSTATSDAVHLVNEGSALIFESVLGTFIGYAVFADEDCDSLVAYTQLWIGVGGNGSHKCMGAYNESWDPLEANCQPPRP